MLDEVIGNYYDFMKKTFENMETIKIDVSAYELDHICYRVATTDEYFLKKQQFEKFSELLVESIVNGRNISTFKLLNPIIYQSRKIYLIELPSPKINTDYTSGLEHVEFVIDKSLPDFIKDYPLINFEINNINNSVNADVKVVFANGITVKFHNETLEEIIKREINFKNRAE